MEFHGDMPYFYWQEEAQYIINGERFTRREAWEKLQEMYGDQEVWIDWVNMTSYSDDCDVFVMGLVSLRDG